MLNNHAEFYVNFYVASVKPLTFCAKFTFHVCTLTPTYTHTHTHTHPLKSNAAHCSTHQ